MVIPPDGVLPVPDGAVDVICSFAVVQHIPHSDFGRVLGEFARVLKPSGRVLCHIPVEKPDWFDEGQWRSDVSLRGRLRLRYALNCFGRATGDVSSAIVAAGLGVPEVCRIGALGPLDDDLREQELFIFRRA